MLARGFQYGTAPNALVIGWNGRHTAATLPDGTPVSSGEGGGVRIGGGGAYQAQFTHHMFLPVDDDLAEADAPFPDAPAPGAPAPDEPAPDGPAVLVTSVNSEELPPPPAGDAGPIGEPEMANG